MRRSISPMKVLTCSFYYHLPSLWSATILHSLIFGLSLTMLLEEEEYSCRLRRFLEDSCFRIVLSLNWKNSIGLVLVISKILAEVPHGFKYLMLQWNLRKKVFLKDGGEGSGMLLNFFCRVERETCIRNFLK